LIVLSYYTIILGLQVLFVSDYFYMLVCHVLSHMRLSCSINITYLLTSLPNGNNVHTTYDFIERIIRLVAFDIVAGVEGL